MGGGGHPAPLHPFIQQNCVLSTGSTFSHVNMKIFMFLCDERCAEDV